MAPQICSMHTRCHSEAKLPRSYDYPLANHIATYKSSANREVSLLSRLYPSFGYLRKLFPPMGLKCSLFRKKNVQVVLAFYSTHYSHRCSIYPYITQVLNDVCCNVYLLPGTMTLPTRSEYLPTTKWGVLTWRRTWRRGD